MSNRNLLIIFVKAPRIGEVKTRLAEHIGVEQAQKLYRAMVEDLLDNLAIIDDIDLLIAVWPQDAKSDVQQWLQWEGQIDSQVPGNLGHKLHRAFEKGFEQGYRHISIIGSDLPELSHSVIKESFHQLHSYPLVLGPAKDGGFYLVGLNSLPEKLFHNINWSTSEVLEKTIENAKNYGFCYFLLPEMNDIDEYEDIQVRWKDLKNNNTHSLPQTTQVLKLIFNSD
jgi:rSAM/selenodomain-associated transferase 1